MNLRSHDLHLTPDLPSELPKEFLRIGESAPASIWGFSFILGLGLPRTYECGTKKLVSSSYIVTNLSFSHIRTHQPFTHMRNYQVTHCYSILLDKVAHCEGNASFEHSSDLFTYVTRRELYSWQQENVLEESVDYGQCWRCLLKLQICWSLSIHLTKNAYSTLVALNRPYLSGIHRVTIFLFRGSLNIQLRTLICTKFSI